MRTKLKKSQIETLVRLNKIIYELSANEIDYDKSILIALFKFFWVLAMSGFWLYGVCIFGMNQMPDSNGYSLKSW